MMRKIPKRSPWGMVQSATWVIPGHWLEVSTTSHGGVKLSREWNCMIPEYARVPGGWYEEDCEAAIPRVFLHGLLQARGLASEDDYLMAKVNLRNWHPDEYERCFGEVIPPGQSRVKDEREFYRKHKEDLLVLTVDPTPGGQYEGMLVATATVGGERQAWGGPPVQERHFLVSEIEYAGRRKGFPFVIDPTRHKEVGVGLLRGGPLGIFERQEGHAG